MEYSAEHGIQAASSRFNLSPKSISNVLYRREQTGLAHDALTLRDLCLFLRVRPNTVLGWIEKGWLLAESQVRKDGRVVRRFQHDAVKRFCNQYRAVLQRRWPKERLDFCESFIFAPKHAELIEGRESKRERQALREQVEREEQQRQIGQAASSDAISMTDRNVVGVRSRNSVRKYDDCA
jgi:hypothetical protein